MRPKTRDDQENQGQIIKALCSLAANQKSVPASQSDVQPKRFRGPSEDSHISSQSNDTLPYDSPHEEAASRDSRLPV